VGRELVAHHCAADRAAPGIPLGMVLQHQA
jgi:hypothetical protein